MSIGTKLETLVFKLLGPAQVGIEEQTVEQPYGRTDAPAEGDASDR
jgi:hypothetical protein